MPVTLATQKPRGVLKKSTPVASIVSPAGGGVKKKDVKDVRQRSRDWVICWRSTERRTAVMQALDAIFKLAANEENFQQFGNDVIQCFYDISSVTHDPVRSRALMYVEQLAQRWRHSVLARGWRGDLVKPPATTILDTIVGLYCMERVGVASNNLKRDLTATLSRVNGTNIQDNYSVIDYFGWDPRAGPPPQGGIIDPASGIQISRYRAMCTSLTYAFYIDSVGLDIGCSYPTILQHLKSIRPYQGPRKFRIWEDYVDQCYLATHVVFTLSNWGELSLESHLLPHEYLFIREHLPIAVRQNDVHLVGEYLECLRVFAVSDADPLVKLGIAFLLNTQSESTHRWDDHLDAYTSYHATMVAAQGLLAHNARGFGPGLITAVPILQAHLLADGTTMQDSLSPDERVTTAVQAAIQAQRQAREKKNSKAESPDLNENNRKRPKISETPVDFATLSTLKNQLDEATRQSDWTATKDVLVSLDNVAVDLELLKSTNLGKDVSLLKKVADTQVATLAKALVRKWKGLLKENGLSGESGNSMVASPPRPISSSSSPKSTTPPITTSNITTSNMKEDDGANALVPPPFPVAVP